MLLELNIERTGDSCPFSNEHIQVQINSGECISLGGVSGAGKSSISLHLMGLRTLPGAKVEVKWGDEVDPTQRAIGMVFQQGVLIDTLNVNENIALALRSSGQPADDETITAAILKVGLSESDLFKMPGQLSGGMLRRASLAQVLAQRKSVIILDEPFVGLDPANGIGICDLVLELMNTGIGFILIAHEPQYNEKVLTKGKDKAIILEEKKDDSKIALSKHWLSRNSFFVRTLLKLFDYFGISTPLIFFAFLAAGFSISMIFIQLLQATDMDTIKKLVLDKGQSGWENFFGYEIYKNVVSYAFDEIAGPKLPGLRQMIFSIGVAKGLAVELCPLLAALLMAGRIGGSYAGEVGTMQATQQNSLLKTLSVSPRSWTLAPSAIAALISAPLLTFLGVAVSIFTAQWLACGTDFGPALYPNAARFMISIKRELFYYKSFWTYGPFAIAYRSLGFMMIILLVAEVIARAKPNLQPRMVPAVVTWSVVISSLLIIIADYGFANITLHAKGGLGTLSQYINLK